MNMVDVAFKQFDDCQDFEEKKFLCLRYMALKADRSIKRLWLCIAIFTGIITWLVAKS